MMVCGNQVEYLVVAVDEKAQKVRLSLRQADILNSLAQEEEQANGELVQGLLDGVYVTNNNYPPMLLIYIYILLFLVALPLIVRFGVIERNRFPSSIRSLDGLCWRRHRDSHGELDSKIS